MPYEMVILQNSPPANPGWPDLYSPPTIWMVKGDDGWDEAVENWKQGKNPTSSKEWKKGVIALFEEPEKWALKVSAQMKEDQLWAECMSPNYPGDS